MAQLRYEAGDLLVLVREQGEEGLDALDGGEDICVVERLTSIALVEEL